MKKHLFIVLAAVISLFSSCAEDDAAIGLSGLKVSQSYVALPIEGGSTDITIESKSEWIITGNDKADWLTISTTQGLQGESKITFSADEAVDGRSVELKLSSANETQNLTIMQGLPVISEATCAEVIAGPEKKIYKVTGVVSNISNTVYGNWNIVDATGKVYVYGTLDAKGNEKNFASLGLEEGDEVTIQGPKESYQGTPQLKNVTVLKINKSLIKVDSVYNDVLPVEGGIFEAYIITKGDGVSVEIPEDAKEWLSIVSIEQNGTDACVKFQAARNEGGDRSTSITFRTTDGKKDYTSKTELSQKGAIVEATVAEFIAAEVGATQYRISGVVTKIANEKYGNIYIKDFSGDVYIYGIKDFADSNIKEGDIVTLVGPRAEYKGTPQMTNAVAEDVKSVKAVTVAEFLEKEESTSQYYQLTGTVSNITNTVYGNFDITDESGKVYVYGLLTGWNGASKQFESLGIVEGDKITICGVRASYRDSDQVGSGFFISKVTE
ncbi:BACON domain-containing protein [uncultured Bacteroides sp.]|uniref:BACON domain-containing protein n=1 Tax=uncultured Bacteroides sp. TaxID=162156 RepID=UPI0025862880|nr:BACON domain-containing protein [uncultured Bacteroides sp.]